MDTAGAGLVGHAYREREAIGANIFDVDAGNVALETLDQRPHDLIDDLRGVEEDLSFFLGCFDQLWIGLIGVGGVRCGIDAHPAEDEADNQDADATRPIVHR